MTLVTGLSGDHAPYAAARFGDVPTATQNEMD
jgi:hypothetical protein